ncbi:MAG: NAD(P)H-dependent glycerol-3-phosphate dehydrogenase [Alphaproteobacteria bacterium]
MSRIAVIGAGAWGTALACVARRAENETILWARDPAVAAAINASAENPNYLPDIPLVSGISATEDLSAAMAGATAVLLVVPAQFLRSVAREMTPNLRAGTLVAICAKGVEQGTLALMSEVLADVLPQAEQVVLSGPTFAQEVARGLPTAVTLAAATTDIAARMSDLIGTARFRPYLSNDPVGAEIGGAVKNVMAIGCGIISGLRLGDNGRAALITRGLTEITRLAVAKGGRAETLMGLSGLGDLTLTCNAMQSRNFSLGVALGEGRALRDILSERRAVTEGVFSAGAVVALAARLGVEMPICQAVDQVVNHGAEIDRTIQALLSRPFTRETGAAD